MSEETDLLEEKGREGKLINGGPYSLQVGVDKRILNFLKDDSIFNWLQSDSIFQITTRAIRKDGRESIEITVEPLKNGKKK